MKNEKIIDLIWSVSLIIQGVLVIIVAADFEIFSGINKAIIIIQMIASVVVIVTSIIKIKKHTKNKKLK